MQTKKYSTRTSRDIVHHLTTLSCNWSVPMDVRAWAADELVEVVGGNRDSWTVACMTSIVPPADGGE